MTNEDTVFGFSLALVGGDIVLVEGATMTENGVTKTLQTLQLVHGKENLLQALNLRVLTPFGSDRLNTNYGLAIEAAFTQPGTIGQTKEYIKLSLVQTLATDPRVHDVRDILFGDDPGYLAQHSQVNVDAIRRSRAWPVEVELDTVDAQTATLSLNIGV